MKNNSTAACSQLIYIQRVSHIGKKKNNDILCAEQIPQTWLQHRKVGLAQPCTSRLSFVQCLTRIWWSWMYKHSSTSSSKSLLSSRVYEYRAPFLTLFKIQATTTTERGPSWDKFFFFHTVLLYILSNTIWVSRTVRAYSHDKRTNARQPL